MRHIARLALASVGLAGFLSACGGGGSDAAAPVPTPPPPPVTLDSVRIVNHGGQTSYTTSVTQYAANKLQHDVRVYGKYPEKIHASLSQDDFQRLATLIETKNVVKALSAPNDRVAPCRHFGMEITITRSDGAHRFAIPGTQICGAAIVPELNEFLDLHSALVAKYGPTQADLQTTVAAPTYASSQEAAFMNAVNALRGRIGLGLLAQNPALDKAARNHAAYLGQHKPNPLELDPWLKRSMLHFEDVAKPGYTGSDELRRARAAGYPEAGEVQEVVADGAASQLGAGVYQRVALMWEHAREIGVATTSLSNTVVEIGFATTQTTAGDFLGVYPGDKQTGVPTDAVAEPELPFADIARSDFRMGFPISVQTHWNTVLETVEFTLTEQGTTQPVAVRQLDTRNDPNFRVPAHILFFVPTGRLKPGTTYTARFRGRVGERSLSRDWSFSTAP